MLLFLKPKHRLELKKHLCIAFSLSALIWPMFSFALTFSLPKDGSNIVGNLMVIMVEPGENLQQIARRYDIGYEEIVRANPKVNPHQPKPWSKIIIPSAFILPDAPKKGIVINLPEMRLYYYSPHTHTVKTFPIGVGRQEWLTPTANTTVIEKVADPEWRVPEAIKEYTLLTKGIELPDIVPAGPENPLGKFALRLGVAGYLIHGTNQPTSIGRRSSSGCIRMYPEDIEELFQDISVGEPVHIINQPFKAGWLDNELYIETHPPFTDQMPKNFEYKNIRDVVSLIVPAKEEKLNWEDIDNYSKQYTGYPIFITKQF